MTPIRVSTETGSFSWLLQQLKNISRNDAPFCFVLAPTQGDRAIDPYRTTQAEIDADDRSDGAAVDILGYQHIPPHAFWHLSELLNRQPGGHECSITYL